MAPQGTELGPSFLWDGRSAGSYWPPERPLHQRIPARWGAELSRRPEQSLGVRPSVGVRVQNRYGVHRHNNLERHTGLLCVLCALRVSALSSSKASRQNCFDAPVTHVRSRL